VKIHNYLDYVRETTSQHGIEFILEPTDKITLDKEQKTGYFDAKEKTLTIARKNTRWLEALIHLHSHFEQWAEMSQKEREEWENKLTYQSLISEWLARKDISPQRIAYAIKYLRSLELDCEKRAIGKITTFDLPLRPELYAQQANAHIYSYDYTLLTRRPTFQAYEDQELTQHLPKRIINYRRIPKKYIRLFDKHFERQHN